MGERVRAFDWAQSPLGQPSHWPHALKSAVAILLRSKQPMYIGWGEQLISFYNDGYIPICGKKHPAALGQPMSVVWAEIWEALEPINLAVLRGEAQLFEDMPFDLAGRGEGGLSYFTFSYTPLLDDDGAISGIFCVAIETTHKVRLERHQAQAIERQRRMFEQAPGFICISTGPDHVFEFVNDAHRRVFGRENIEGKSVREAFPDLEGQGIYEALDRVYRTGERYLARGINVRFRATPSSAEVQLRLDFMYAPIFDEAGAVSGVFCEGHDVSEAFAAQGALQEREEQLRLATEAAEIGLWDLDPLHDALFWPPRVKAMFGISPDVPISMADFYAGLHPDDREATVQAFAAACDPQQKALYDVEYRTIGKEAGVVRWIAAKGRAIFDEHDRCIRVIGTAIDISKRKENEAALLASEERLRVSDRHKGEFIATLAHELRNPLAPLRTGLEVLRGRGQTDPLHATMERQVHHLVRLVDDLLEVSRINNGAFELRKEPQDLAQVVRNALEASDSLVQEQQHRVELVFPGSPAWVNGDGIRLTQIISNLLNNAARYTPPGGLIQVTVELEARTVTVKVRDSGIGFDVQHGESIFEMFKRGKQSTGLGIGLSLSRKLAEMHGGELDASSEGQDRGAEFVLTLPRLQDTPETRPSPAPVTRPFEHAGRQVLVVDDNEDAADTLEMLLRQMGVAVSVAYDGESAMQKFGEQEPSLVLLDIGMPLMDGYELARRLRTAFPQHRARVVGLSGWGQEDDRRRGREAGFHAHLVKPVDLGELVKLLESQ